MKNSKVCLTAFCGICLAMNIVPDILLSPDTVLTSAPFGPVPGMIIGVCPRVLH